MFELTPFRKGNFPKRDDFFDKIQSYFNDGFDDFPQVFKNDLKVDLKENDKEYIVEAELPGVKKEDIEVTFNDNYLTIAAKRDEVIDEKNENYIRKERNYGTIQRTFYVDDVYADKISASFNEGILKLNLPKKPGTKNNNKINID